MKILRLVIATLIVGGLFHSGPVAAQGAATYSKEAMDDLVGLLKKAGNEGYAMEPSTTTMFGGWLPRGKAVGNERWIPMLQLPNLDPKFLYRIIAAGDNDTKDLDLRVVDPTGKVVAIDATTLRNSEVTFRPIRRQTYVIEMRLYDSNDNCICIGAILRK